eukprot:scaffold243498_cov30-Attheya_sp.AAC.1
MDFVLDRQQAYDTYSAERDPAMGLFASMFAKNQKVTQQPSLPWEETRQKPSLSIDSGAMPSKVKHLGATDSDNEAKYCKNQGEDADAKKKKY